jgi:Xaa-Pro aminopeptidase
MEACPKNVGFTGLMLLGSGHEYFAWGPPTWTYRPQAPRIIQEGDVTVAEISCSFGMLETQHQPCIAVGKVHADFEKAAEIARESYEIGLSKLRPGHRFGEVVDAMEEPVRRAGGRHVHPWIHSLNPFGLISGLQGLSETPGAEHYGRIGDIPLAGRDVELRRGMTFALEPNCALERHLVNVGGTVVVSGAAPLELNHIATSLMRV